MKKSRFGSAFVDEFKKTSFKSGHFDVSKKVSSDWIDSLIAGNSGEHNSTSLVSIWRRVFLSVFFLLFFAVLLFRLFHLQIVKGDENRSLADSNRIQVKIIHAPRGVIYDRNGKILARNEPGFRLVEIDKSGQTHVSLISRDEALKMEVNNDPRFKNLELDTIRNYPYSEKTSHILGYVGEITPDELKDPKFLNYKSGDKVGRGGVEETYEKILRGIDGGEVIEVDAQGKKKRTLRRTEAIPGQKLILGIDADLQNIAFQKLSEGVKKVGSCCGSLVAEDPKTGEILALVSYPSYDPKNLSDALTAPNSPILNRVIGGSYPPGSTYKIASALAGLTSGKITASTRFEDTGVLELGPYKFANWYFTEYGRKEEGGVDIVKALKRSNDIFFYKLGESTGEEVLGDFSRRLGLGEKLGIDIPGEVVGLIPDDNWKRKNFGEAWYPGDTLHMAIGQGFVLTTPLQINNLTLTIASGGKQYPPHLAMKITTSWDYLIKKFSFDPINKKDFKKEDINLVKRGLEEVPVQGGTAWPFFNFPIKTAGKTGTAEFGEPKNEKGTIGQYSTHAWYTSYAPTDDPKIVMTVMVEAGGEGSNVAAPIAKEVYRYYFSEDKNNLIKDIAPISTESAKILGE